MQRTTVKTTKHRDGQRMQCDVSLNNQRTNNDLKTNSDVNCEE